MEQRIKQEPSNNDLSRSFVLIRFDQSLKDANEELKDKGGTPDWVLLVQLEDGSILGAPFHAISEWIRDKRRLDIELFDLLDETLSVLIPVETLDQFESDLTLIQRKASANPYGLVAIVAFGNVVWIYTEQVIASAENVPIPPGQRIVVDEELVSPVQPNAWAKTKAFYQKYKIGIIIAGFWFVATTIVSFVFPLLQTNLSDLLPSLFPPVMTGEWNLVVAGFTPVGEDSISSKDARHISEVYYNHFFNEIENLGTEIGLYVQMLGPGDTPQITGTTPEDREVKASSLANKMKADMIVYGTIERVGDGYMLTPEFYVNIRNFYEASEMVGQHVLGSAIRLFGVGEDLYAQINLNKELSNRSQVLALIAKGLGLYLTHQYDFALDMFTEANADELWDIDSGREVVYLFRGNAALRADKLKKAEQAYRDALAIDSHYSRAYVGLGSTYYLFALQSGQAGSFAPDAEDLDRALEYYQSALSAEHQPATADIATKVAFGKGIIYLTQWLSGQDTMHEAMGNFTDVIEEFERNENERVQEAASEAHAHLGLIARQNQNSETAIREYVSAVELATNPARRGLYWDILGGLYRDRGEGELSEHGYANCVSEYTAAIKLTTQPDRRAGYWGKIAACYQALGELPDAIFAVDQAIKLSPQDSDEIKEYEALLLELQSTQSE